MTSFNVRLPRAADGADRWERGVNSWFGIDRCGGGVPTTTPYYRMLSNGWTNASRRTGTVHKLTAKWAETVDWGGDGRWP